LILVTSYDLPGLPPRFSKRSLGTLVCNRSVDSVSTEILAKDCAIETQLFLTTLVLSQLRSGKANLTKAIVAGALYCVAHAYRDRSFAIRRRARRRE
jgi:hypothetical protein